MTRDQAAALDAQMANDSALRELLMFEPENAGELGFSLSGEDADVILLGAKVLEDQALAKASVREQDKMAVLVFKVAH